MKKLTNSSQVLVYNGSFSATQAPYKTMLLAPISNVNLPFLTAAHLRLDNSDDGPGQEFDPHTCISMELGLGGESRPITIDNEVHVMLLHGSNVVMHKRPLGETEFETIRFSPVFCINIPAHTPFYITGQMKLLIMSAGRARFHMKKKKLEGV